LATIAHKAQLHNHCLNKDSMTFHKYSKLWLQKGVRYCYLCVALATSTGTPQNTIQDCHIDAPCI